MLKQIFIANILEAFYRSYKNLNRQDRLYWIRYDTLDSNRSLLYGEDDKIIVTPTPIHPDHFAYTGKLAGWKNTANIYPSKSTASICLDILNDPRLKSSFVQILKHSPGVEIIPYRHTDEFYLLVDFLHSRGLKFTLPETPPSDLRFVESYFHSKKGFRHLWEMVKNRDLPINIPEGFIAANREEAAAAARYFYNLEKDFLFKYNRGVQGVGIIFNQFRDLPKSEKNFQGRVKRLLRDDIWSDDCIIVEEKIIPDPSVLGGSPNVEMKILPDGEVTQSYACEQILDPDGKTFLGIGISPGVLKNQYINTAFQAASRIGLKLSRYGIRGVFDMDLVVSRDQKLYAVETNIRRTGGTHIHEFCQSLFGKDYHRNYWIKSYDLKFSPAPKNEFLDYRRLRELFADIEGSKKRRTGVYFVNPDLLRMNILVLLLVAADCEELNRLEASIKKIVKKLSLSLPF